MRRPPRDRQYRPPSLDDSGEGAVLAEITAGRQDDDLALLRRAEMDGARRPGVLEAIAARQDVIDREG